MVLTELRDEVGCRIDKELQNDYEHDQEVEGCVIAKFGASRLALSIELLKVRWRAYRADFHFNFF